jgi:hypothetical protein
VLIVYTAALIALCLALLPVVRRLPAVPAWHPAAQAGVVVLLGNATICTIVVAGWALIT